MKIKCTLKEFELLSARCPMNTSLIFLIDDDKFDKLYDECKTKCVLSNFCRYGESDSVHWSLADLVEIVSEKND